MEENHKRVFTTIWVVLLLCSVVLGHITNHSEVAWAQSESITLLSSILFWITTIITIALFVWHNILYWRQGKRLFWRKWQKWAKGLMIGISTLVVLLLAINTLRGDEISVSNGERLTIFLTFVIGGLIYGLARLKSNSQNNIIASNHAHYTENSSKWLSKFKIMVITICGVVGVATVITLKYAFNRSIDLGHSVLFWLCVACIVVGSVMWVLTHREK